MIELTYDSLSKFLKSKEIQADYQEQTQQLTYPLTIDGIEFHVYVRIFEKSNLLQFLTFMPMPFQTGMEADLARLLLFINKELDVPGFGMDEPNEVVFHRIMLPFVDENIDERILENYLKSIEMICQTFAPAIVTLSMGKTSFDEIMTKIKQANKETPK